MFSFLTPELFNGLIVINLIVSIGLVVWRFSMDMRRDDRSQK
jgi:hypothetical protein